MPCDAPTITIGLLQGVPLREMQRAARHSNADTTVAYDQSDRSYLRDPTFALMTATARWADPADASHEGSGSASEYRGYRKLAN